MNDIIKNAENIGRQFGIKKVIGVILRNDDTLAYHTRCLLCGNISDVDCESFLEKPTFQVSCRACKATLSYDTGKTKEATAPATPEKKSHTKPKSKSKQKQTPKVSTTSSNLKPATATQKPQTSVRATQKETTRNTYQTLVGEMINHRKIIEYHANKNRHFYTVECPECGSVAQLECSMVVNMPDIVPGCNCIFNKLGIAKPQIGDVYNGWEITRIYKTYTWLVDIKCIACGTTRKGVRIKLWTEMKPHDGCGKVLNTKPEPTAAEHSLLETSNNTESHYALMPITSNQTMARNPKFPLPGIVTKGSREFIDTTTCPQLFSVYKSMVKRAKELRVPICLKWYDDGLSVAQNVQGFTAFYMWSMRNGYCEAESKSGRNLTRFIRKDPVFGFDEDNCEWTFIGANR